MPELKDFEDNKNPHCQHSLTTRIFVLGGSLLSKNVYYMLFLFVSLFTPDMVQLT